MQIPRSSRFSLLVLLVGILWIGVSGSVFGHAHLEMSSPARDAIVTEAPSQVTLRFSEPVEIQFSTFKVYPLPSEEDDQRLRAAASALFADVINKRGDEANRVDAGVTTTARTSASITISLSDDLEPGSYVVMWRVLSIDTHIVQGHYVFTYDPNQPATE